MYGDTKTSKPKKRIEDMKKSELWGNVANKICNTVFSAGAIVRRTKVYKQREMNLKQKMIENMAVGNNSEAFAFAYSVLTEKRKIAWILELAERTIDFTNFFKSQLDDLDNELFSCLDKISYLVSNGFLLELEKEITRAEIDFGYLKIQEEIAMSQGKELKRVVMKVTKRQIRAYMRKVRSDPKVISTMTMQISRLDSSKLKSAMDFRSRNKQSKSMINW